MTKVLSLLPVVLYLSLQTAYAARPCQSQPAADALGAMAQDAAKDWAMERFKDRHIQFEAVQGSLNFELTRQRMQNKRFDCSVISRTFNQGDSVLRVNMQCTFEHALPVVYGYSLKACEEKEALVATKEVRRGRPLSSDWLTSGRISVPLASTPLTMSTLHSGGWQINRFVMAGDVVDDKMVELIPSVVKGRTTTVNVSAGTASVAFAVKATRDGRIGERIKVRTQSGAIVEGTVVGQNLIGIQDN